MKNVWMLNVACVLACGCAAPSTVRPAAQPDGDSRVTAVAQVSPSGRGAGEPSVAPLQVVQREVEATDSHPKLWVYEPAREATEKLPLVLIAPAGSTCLAGMPLGQGDVPEHRPWVEAGYLGGARSWRYAVGQGTCLRHGERDGISRDYGYDPDGNRLDGGGAQYAAGDRLVHDANFDYIYTRCGQLRSGVERALGGASEHEWNDRGQLSVTRTADGRTVSCSYDPLGRRVIKRVAWKDEQDGLVESCTRYVWDGKALLHEMTSESNAPDVVRRRTYVFEASRTVPMMHCDEEVCGSKFASASWWHYLNDDSGAPELLVAPDGHVGAHLERSPWGDVAFRDSEVTTPFRLRGQYADRETGLSYNLHRYYDPKSGRYISADPVGLSGGINAFVYANNCPTSAIDVEGLMYSVIKDGQGNVVATGLNQSMGGGVANPQFGRGSCAETTALHDLMAKKGAAKGDIAKLFNEEGYTIETYEGGARDQKLAANPCPGCAEMFQDQLGIKTGVLAHNNKSKETVKPWDGSSTYKPTSKGQMQNSRRKKR